LKKITKLILLKKPMQNDKIARSRILTNQTSRDETWKKKKPTTQKNLKNKSENKKIITIRV
jgi:hypothetical protein